MKHIKRQIRRNVRAISPVLAVLMMIAVAIAGSLVVYAWIMGYIDLSTARSGQSIQIQSVANEDDGDTNQTNNDLLVYVQNVGEGVVQLDESDCLYVNGQLVPCIITGVTVSDDMATLNEGETATLRYIDGGALPGEKMKVKVTTLAGTGAEKSSYPAGSARAAPIFDHFEFGPIDDPQIAGIEFRITLMSVDQYGEAFEYIGVNNLVYSGGTISPAVTGGFINGLWTGNVTLEGTATSATISTSATSDSTWVGISNTFTVNPMVTYVSAGNGGRAGTAVESTNLRDPTYPSGLQEDDLILLQIGIRDGTNSPDETLLNAEGFTLLYEDQDTGTDIGQWIYYMFSDGTETGSVAIPLVGSPASVTSCMYAFRYVALTDFTEDGDFGTQASDIIYAETVTTTGARELAVSFIYMTGYEGSVASFDGETGGDWERQVEFVNQISGTYDDAAIQLQTAEMIEAGEISGGTTREDDMISQQESWGVRAFALIPTS